MRVQSSLKGAKPRGKAKKMCEDLAVQKKSISFALVIEKVTSYHMGKCYTASSFRILQGLIAAKVVSCSGAMWRAFPPASLAQLARARDL